MASTPWDSEFTARLANAFGTAGVTFETYVGQNFVTLPASRIVEAVRYLYSSEQFDFLVDLTAVDRPKDPQRFELIYILYSFARNERIRLKTKISESEAALSLSGIFKGANWLEREVFDMFGIQFEGHPDMKRILLPDGWKGHPLRKDYGIIQQDNEWVQINLGIESGQ